MRPELQDMTVSDWMDAKNSMQGGAFQRLVRTAKAGDISVPSVVAINFKPRLEFVSLSDTANFLRLKDVERVNEFNADIKVWAAKVETQLKASAESRFGHRRDASATFPHLADSIATNLRFDKQFKLETRSVGFTLARHGVYLHVGAGRGYAGSTGSKWTDKYGKMQTTNKNSMGQMGTGARTAEHWFNEIINNNTDELADILANYSLDMALNIDSIFLPE